MTVLVGYGSRRHSWKVCLRRLATYILVFCTWPFRFFIQLVQRLGGGLVLRSGWSLTGGSGAGLLLWIIIYVLGQPFVAWDPRLDELWAVLSLSLSIFLCSLLVEALFFGGGLLSTGCLMLGFGAIWKGLTLWYEGQPGHIYTGQHASTTASQFQFHDDLFWSLVGVGLCSIVASGIRGLWGWLNAADKPTTSVTSGRQTVQPQVGSQRLDQNAAGLDVAAGFRKGLQWGRFAVLLPFTLVGTAVGGAWKMARRRIWPTAADEVLKDWEDDWEPVLSAAVDAFDEGLGALEAGGLTMELARQGDWPAGIAEALQLWRSKLRAELPDRSGGGGPRGGEGTEEGLAASIVLHHELKKAVATVIYNRNRLRGRADDADARGERQLAYVLEQLHRELDDLSEAWKAKLVRLQEQIQGAKMDPFLKD